MSLGNWDRLNAGVLLLLAVCIAGAYAFRVHNRGRAYFERVEAQRGGALFGKWAMEAAYWGLQPVSDGLVKLGVTANHITWVSLVLGLLAGILLAFGSFGAGAMISAISALLDSVDGMIARKTGTASHAGEILDASVDRYTEFFFLGGLAFYYRLEPVYFFVALAALVGSYMVSYSTAKAEILGIQPHIGGMRRPERATYLVLGAALTAILPSLSIMPFALGLVAVASNYYAIARLREIAHRSRPDSRKSQPLQEKPIPHAALENPHSH